MRYLLLALPLLAACATGPAPRPPEPRLPAGTWVDLHFAWEPGLVAETETTHVRSSPGDRGPERTEVRVRARLAVEAEPRGLAVRVEGLRHELPERPTPAEIELLAEELAAPDRLVGPAGNLLAVEAREEARADVQRALVALSRLGPVPGSFRERILGKLRPAALEADAREEWDRLVGFWAGASLEAGRIYEARDLVPIELLAGLPVEAVVRMRLVDRVPCGDEGPEAAPRCVALELTAVPDPESTQGLAPFLARLFGQSDAAGRLSFEERTALVAEPEGLRPHRLETYRRVAVDFGTDGPDPFERVDERTVVFAYPGTRDR
jgi:hypothetical protein